MKRILIVLFISVCNIIYIYAQPRANFGDYGIKFHPKYAGYKQYIGQTVKYIKSSSSKSGNYYDKEFFINKGGNFENEYIIKNITGSSKQMTFILQDKNNGNKINLRVYNGYHKSYEYCIMEEYSIPLLLVDKLNQEKDNLIGKIYSNSNESVQLECTDIFFKESFSDLYPNDTYPVLFMELKDKIDSKIYHFNLTNIEFIKELANEFHDSKYKCFYTIVNVYFKTPDYYVYNNLKEKYYTVKNSIDGSEKEVLAKDAAEKSFEGDNQGSFFASLTKVEKPTNTSVRYGTTTTITEKGITKYSYKDNIINIIIGALKSEFYFTLENVSNNSLKVIWNEAAFVDVDGSSSKIMHYGIKYSQKEGDQPATTIIKGSKLEDIAAPINKVYYSSLLEEWTSMSLFSNANKNIEGQTIKLMLPIQVKDIINEYIFEFALSYKYFHPEYLSDTYYEIK